MHKEKAISFIYEIKEHFFIKFGSIKPRKLQRHSQILAKKVIIFFAYVQTIVLETGSSRPLSASHVS